VVLGVLIIAIAVGLPDYVMLADMAARLEADLQRWEMGDLYPFPEELLVDSQVRMARHRVQGFDLVRSNPSLCGFNLTGMLDHALTGEGLWTLWRTWKPGALDALQNGWASLRWCLFVEPSHAYAGRPFRIEAVLANEDVLGPGRYPVTFRLFGPNGVAWERREEILRSRSRFSKRRSPSAALPEHTASLLTWSMAAHR
jgi:hypothetical protein